MNLHKNILLCTLLALLLCCGQVQGQSDFTINYRIVTLDSTYAHHPDTAMQAYINEHKAQMDVVMGEVIGHCTRDLTYSMPQSPLSNLLTRMLYDIGDIYCMEQTGKAADLSLLNFGGIRAYMPKGDITVGTIYNILPFDNSIVIITLKGSELKKAFDRMTPTNCQPYSNAQIIYQNDHPAIIKINHRKLKPNKLYRLVTIDFIQTGGDKILEGIQYEDVIATHYLLRTAVMDYIRDMSRGAWGCTRVDVNSELDDRVIIK